MDRFTGRPLTFLITGFGWLLLSSLVGLAILIGLVHGTPLPSWMRLVHVHAILIGGILQLMIGGLLASLSSDSQSSHAGSNSRPWLFATLNAATVLLLIGFGLGNMKVVGGAGIILIGAVASVAPAAWQYARQTRLNQPAPLGYTVFHSSPYSLDWLSASRWPSSSSNHTMPMRDFFIYT